MTYQVSVATLMHEAAENCALNLGALAVAPVDETVVVPEVTALIVV
jgi:hypothetical protein